MIIINKPYKILSILIFFIFLGFISCMHQSGEGEESVSIFNSEELLSMHEIVAYHDSIVKTNTADFLDIDSAYILYLDSVCPLILKSGDFSLSGINARSRERLIDRLNKTNLGEIYIVGDTLEYFSMDIKKRVKKYFPYYLTMNINGKYTELLKKMSEDNVFIDKYYKNMIESGDLSPTCFGMILRDHDQLDFSSSDQRLIYIVTILRVNESIKDRFIR